MRDPAKRDARLIDGAAVEVEADSDGNQSKGVGETIPDLQIAEVTSETLRRQLDRYDDLVCGKGSVDLGLIVWKTMKLGERNCAIAVRPGRMHNGLERGKRHAHIRRMHGDAGFAPAQDRIHAVEAVAGAAAGARARLLQAVVVS